MKKFDFIFIFLLVIFSLNFFSARFAANGIFKTISYTYMLGTAAISAPHFFKGSSGFTFPVRMFVAAVLLSIIVCYISWGQSLSFALTTIPYLMWVVFFYLLYRQFPLRQIELIVIIYGFIYMLLYAYQFMHSNVVYFGFKEEFVEDRGIIRINFPGAGVLFLGYFIALNRVTEKFRWVFALFILLGVLVTVLQVTRQSIAMLLFITLFHFVKQAALTIKIAILVCFTGLIIYVFNANTPIAKGLIETQKETVDEGSSNIRVLASGYFLNQFSPNVINRAFGNGVPNLNSAYGKFTAYLEENYGYYVSDVGLIGMYVYFGVFAVLSYIIIFCKGLLMAVPAHYIYLKYYLLFLLVTSLTSDNVYSINFMITNVFVLYGFQRVYQQKKVLEVISYNVTRVAA